MARWCFWLAILSLWTSVPVSAYGTHLMSTAPQYAAYWDEAATRMAADSPGEDIGPSVGVGLALASAWPFAALCHAAGAAVATAGLIAVWCAAGRIRTVGLLVCVPVVAGCAVGVLPIARSAGESLRWGFGVLAAGEILAASGFALVGLSAVAITSRRPNAEPL